MAHVNGRHVFYDLLISVPAIWFIFHIFSLTPFWRWTRVHERFCRDATLLLHQINMLFFKSWMSMLLVCFVVSGTNFSAKKVYKHYASVYFLLQPATRKARIGCKNTGTIRNSILLICYCHYKSKKRFPVRLKATASPPYSHLNSIIRIKALLVHGLQQKY